jgi:hypothetical protein
MIWVFDASWCRDHGVAILPSGSSRTPHAGNPARRTIV